MNDDDDRETLKDSRKRNAYLLSPWDRTPEQQEWAEDYYGALVRAGLETP